jgi:hypothetical protein
MASAHPRRDPCTFDPAATTDVINDGEMLREVSPMSLSLRILSMIRALLDGLVLVSFRTILLQSLP